MPGAILWLTGLSGAGKTTLAGAVADRIGAASRVEILDGEELRSRISPDLGFSKADRDANVRRIGFIARLLARHGVLVIAAAISPYADTRDEVRREAEHERIRFLEVFVDASLETLIARDVKGLYRRALAGEIDRFTGISDPYERPSHPDLIVKTDSASVEESTSRIVRKLMDEGLIGA
jgi:adenylyl-sulfate kinase